MTDTKWKDILLKSSLPFEHVVASQLADADWIVWGQYTYPRTNESGQTVDFSADLRATKEYSSRTHWLATLDILVECKYASPGVRWVFLPYPTTSTLFSGLVNVFEQVANKRVASRIALEDFERTLDYCIRGIALHDSGCDEAAINRGASQLRYAMPRLAESTFATHATDWHDEDIAITFACAILVTTAPLYCLKPGLSLDDVRAATSLDDILEPRDALVLWDSESPDRARYARGVYEQVPAEVAEKRIQEYAAVFKATSKIKYPPDAASAKRSLAQAGDHVLVVNAAHFRSVTNALDKSVRKTVKQIRPIASVRLDREDGCAKIGPLETATTPKRRRNGA